MIKITREISVRDMPDTSVGNYVVVVTTGLKVFGLTVASWEKMK